MKSEFCYNCGVELIPKSVARRMKDKPDENLIATSEHIPPKSLFSGFSYTGKIVTVPVCRKCNHEYGKSDEEFRDAMGLMLSDHKAMNQITEDSIRAAKRKKYIEKGRIVFSDNGDGTYQFNNDAFFNVNQKNFKALFRKQYGIILPSNYIPGVILDHTLGVEQKQHKQMLFNWLTYHFEWKHSGSPDVFKYIIQPFVDVPPKNKVDLPFTGNGQPLILGAFVYCNLWSTLVGASQS